MISALRIPNPGYSVLFRNLKTSCMVWTHEDLMWNNALQAWSTPLIQPLYTHSLRQAEIWRLGISYRDSVPSMIDI